MIPNAFNPQWNHTCEFEEVPSNASLKILVLNKQRIRADAVIGKVKSNGRVSHDCIWYPSTNGGLSCVLQASLSLNRVHGLKPLNERLKLRPEK